MELCSGKDLEVIQLHFPTKTKTIISQSCIPDHSSLWILKVELIYFPHSVRINSLWVGDISRSDGALLQVQQPAPHVLSNWDLSLIVTTQKVHLSNTYHFGFTMVPCIGMHILVFDRTQIKKNWTSSTIKKSQSLNPKKMGSSWHMPSIFEFSLFLVTPLKLPLF